MLHRIGLADLLTIPQQVFNDSLYEIYFRFLETDDEYFDYAPAPIPPQGRWKISGIDLPDGILHKVYNQNATRLLHVAAGSTGKFFSNLQLAN
jgi:hypothetical protein